MSNRSSLERRSNQVTPAGDVAEKPREARERDKLKQMQARIYALAVILLLVVALLAGILAALLTGFLPRTAPGLSCPDEATGPGTLCAQVELLKDDIAAIRGFHGHDAAATIATAPHATATLTATDAAAAAATISTSAAAATFPAAAIASAAAAAPAARAEHSVGVQEGRKLDPRRHHRQPVGRCGPRGDARRIPPLRRRRQQADGAARVHPPRGQPRCGISPHISAYVEAQMG